MAKKQHKTLITAAVARRIAKEQGWVPYKVEGIPESMTFKRLPTPEADSLNSKAYLIAFYLGADVLSPESYCYWSIVTTPMHSKEIEAQQYKDAAISLKDYYDKRHGN